MPPPTPSPASENLPYLDAILAERMETDFYAFVRNGFEHLDPVPFVNGRHVAIMCEYLEAFIAGEIPRLLLNIPPGHMKSLTVSVLLNAWAWTKPERTGLRFMATSYRADLALRDADKTRQLIRSEWYQQRWGNIVGALRETNLQIRKDQDQKTRFANSKGGYRFSTSTAGIMGEGGDFVIMDDPHNVEQAESDDNRDAIVERIRMALPTRIRSKNGGACVMMQRLHERDYAGHIIADEAELVHLCLPARYEKKHPFVSVPITLEKSGRELPGDFRSKEGELLWPELFDEPRLSTLEKEIGSYATAGQLQQRPAPREGGLFKRIWFKGKFMDKSEMPKKGSWVRGWDLAATDEQASGGSKAAWTVGLLLFYAKPMIIVVDVVRLRGSPLKVRTTMTDTGEADGKGVIIDFPQDPGQAGKAQAQDIAADFPTHRIYFSPESGDKALRAAAPAAQAEAGNVYIVRGSWNTVFLDELCQFPGGSFADQVDALSRAYHRAARKPKPPSSGSVSGAT